MASNGSIDLQALERRDVPVELRPETYFDWQAHPFAHRALFDDCNCVCTAIRQIAVFARNWLAQVETTGDHLVKTASTGEYHSVASFVVYSAGETPHRIIVEDGARIIDARFDVTGGDIYVGAGTVIEPGALIKGPAIIGGGCELRKSAFIRGNCIIGDGCVIGGELKNVVLMDNGNYPHPSYIGDSLCGYAGHFGNQATAANLGIFQGMKPGNYDPLIVECNGSRYNTGAAKMGVCLGDWSQVGCSAVLDPGTFLGPRTIVYSLSRVSKGFYGPDEIIKNKPHEHGVLERAPLRSTS